MMLSQTMTKASKQIRWQTTERLVRTVSSKHLAHSNKTRIVIVGSGWGGFGFLKAIDKEKYDVHVVSPANHFLFTPLLPSSVVGTLEFRAIQEPVRTVKNIGGYYQAKARRIDYEKRELICEDIFKINEEFKLEFDYLVVACGSKTNTFGTPGIQEREGKEVFFLKHLYHARQVRNRILECFEQAAIHQTNPAERDRLLSFVVVGGGPTSCELVGELHDFIHQDVIRFYPDLVPHISIHLVEASPKLLGSFDASIATFVKRKFQSKQIKVKTGVAVKSYDHITGKAYLSDDTSLDVGMLVWSAGLSQVRFVEDSFQDIPKGPGGRLQIDEFLRIESKRCQGRIFAYGDCAINPAEPLAPLAQVAKQQSTYLAKIFNSARDHVLPDELVVNGKTKGFKYYSLGSLVTFGGFQGALDLTAVGSNNKTSNLGRMQGLLSFLIWRSAYFMRQDSWSSRILIPLYWFKSFVLGRDISRF